MLPTLIKHSEVSHTKKLASANKKVKMSCLQEELLSLNSFSLVSLHRDWRNLRTEEIVDKDDATVLYE